MDHSSRDSTSARRGSPRRLRALAAATFLALALTGCVSITSNEDAARINDVTRSVSAEGYSVLLGTGTLGGPAQAALLEGELVLGSGNCFQVLDAAGTAVGVLFPQGTTVIGGAVPGLDIDGKKFIVGDKVALGGGFGSLSDKAGQSAGACVGEQELFVVHTLEP